MTISLLAQLNKANGGYFFSRDTLKHNHETLKTFAIESECDNRCVVCRVNEPSGTHWTFDKTTGRVIQGGIRLTVQPHVVPMVNA